MIEILKNNKYKQSTKKRVALISLKKFTVSGQAKREKEYTMKSLILAQDER